MANVVSQEDWGDVDDSDPQKHKVKTKPVYLDEKHFYRVVVWSLAIVASAALIGSIYLITDGKDIPDGIIALGSTAVGALAGVLAGNH